jgi:hypothetical protein
MFPLPEHGAADDIGLQTPSAASACNAKRDAASTRPAPALSFLLRYAVAGWLVNPAAY